MKTRSFTHYTLDNLRWYKWWLPFIEIAFDKIEEHLKEVDLPNFKISYIKDKYWGIRFEEMWFDDYISKILRDLEWDTHNICERCWCKWEGRDWWRIYTLCDYCYDLSLKKNKDGST